MLQCFAFAPEESPVLRVRVRRGKNIYVYISWFACLICRPGSLPDIHFFSARTRLNIRMSQNTDTGKILVYT